VQSAAPKADSTGADAPESGHQRAQGRKPIPRPQAATGCPANPEPQIPNPAETGVSELDSARRGAGQFGDGVRVGGPADGTTAIDGRTQPVRRFMVTVMVEQRKLIVGVSRHFPHPSATLATKPVLQINGLSETVSVFGRFLDYQILPNFTNFDQKRAANGQEGGR